MESRKKNRVTELRSLNCSEIVPDESVISQVKENKVSDFDPTIEISLLTLYIKAFNFSRSDIYLGQKYFLRSEIF